MSSQRFTDPGENRPTHAPNGAKIIRWEIKTDNNVRFHRRMPPCPPSRDVVTEWDDDGAVAWRTMTDEEFAAAQEAFKKTAAEWDRTLGQFATFGPQTSELRVECDDGTTGRAAWTGEEWRWLEWRELSTKEKANREEREA